MNVYGSAIALVCNDAEEILEPYQGQVNLGVFEGWVNGNSFEPRPVRPDVSVG